MAERNGSKPRDGGLRRAIGINGWINRNYYRPSAGVNGAGKTVFIDETETEAVTTGGRVEAS